MFLRNKGFSGRFTFDVIYSCLQKSLRRNDLKLSLEMAYEFEKYPNALKNRLIQNCCEDCPNLNLIIEIYNTKAETINDLLKFIPVICNHVKSHEGVFVMRIAVEQPLLKEPINLETDTDILTLSRKCLYYMIQDRYKEFINIFENYYHMPLLKIYNKIKHYTFLYMLIDWHCGFKNQNITYTIQNTKFSKKFTNNLILPEYVYDKHVHCSKNKSFAYFIDNIILSPRLPISEYELQARELYKTTNIGTGTIIKQLQEKYNNKLQNLNQPLHETITDVKLIQTQLITSKHKPFVYFCDLNNENSYKYILKGPYSEETDIKLQIISNKLKNHLFRTDKYNSKIVCYAGPFKEGVYYQNQLYLLSHNIIPINPKKVQIMNSKLEHGVLIYIGDKYLIDKDDQLYCKEDNTIIDLLMIIAFRKIIGANDTCNRNIIYYEKTFYSIDDAILYDNYVGEKPYIYTKYMFKNMLSGELYYVYKHYIEIYFPDVLTILNDWEQKLLKSKGLTDKFLKYALQNINSLKSIENWHF